MAFPAAATTAVTLADLPHDMLREIAARLPRPSIGALALTCKATRDSLVERPSLLWRAVTCSASFLASSNDPAARVLRSRAAEVKNMGLRAATARAAPALGRFTSLESIVMGLLSIKDGERLLNAAAAASPRLATAKLVFPEARAVPGTSVDLTFNAPQLTRLVLVGQLDTTVVRLDSGDWNTPALETLEFKGFVPAIPLVFSDVRHDEFEAVVQAEPELVAAKRAHAAAIAAGVGVAEAKAAVGQAYVVVVGRVLGRRARALIDAGKSVVHPPPRLRKVVVPARALVLPLSHVPLSALAAEGVDVVYE